MHNREHKRFEVTVIITYIIILSYLLVANELDIVLSRFIFFFFCGEGGQIFLSDNYFQFLDWFVWFSYIVFSITAVCKTVVNYIIAPSYPLANIMHLRLYCGIYIFIFFYETIRTKRKCDKKLKTITLPLTHY